jgi:DNA repair protein RecO (recombination protein O)
MTLVKDTAIVLRRLDYSESSQVLCVFTREHGQQRLIAKGIKRPTKARASTGIDLLEKGRLVFSLRPGKEDVLGTLTEWRQEDVFPHLRRDLTACYAGLYAAEATAGLTEVHDAHPALFDHLQSFLASLTADRPAAVLSYFLWQLLTEVGLKPELERCMNCGRSMAGEAVVYFSSREGGAVCRDCESTIVEKRRMAPGTGGVLDCGGPEKPGLDRQVFELLDYHISHTLGRPGRLSLPLLEMLKSAAGSRPVNSAR